MKSGTIKVKFKPETAGKLSSLPTSFSASLYNNAALEIVAKRYKATPMRRLFKKSPNEALEERHRKHGLHLWYIFEVDSTVDINEVMSAYGEVDQFSLVEGEYIKTLSPYQATKVNLLATSTDNLPFDDVHLTKQWHYKYDNQFDTIKNGFDINLFEAWKLNTGSPEVIVSIHDEGVDTSHPDLVENIWINLAELNGEPGVDDDNNGYVDDVNGWNFTENKGEISPQNHGTHVAGTVSATNNNGIGVAGVAGGSGNSDGVRIMPMQFLGGGSVASSYVYAADNGAVISQNSWGYTVPGLYEQSVLDAIDYFISEAGNYPDSPMKGGIVIFAAGNANHDGEWWPGYYDKCLTVGAIGPDGKKTSYSNYGEWVDISAPGGEFKYGSAAGVLSTFPNGEYGYLNGTSMACPHVSGIAALVLSNTSDVITPDQLRKILLTSNQPIEHINKEYSGKLGTGNIDANLALQEDNGIAPDKINDLSVKKISNDFVILKWTVPSDKDDTTPEEFKLYFDTKELNGDNLTSAEDHITIPIIENIGDTITFEVKKLLGLTDYFFAVESVDRWGNVSEESNILTVTTNAGPKIVLSEDADNIEIITNSGNEYQNTHTFNIRNEEEGLLRWTFSSRHVNSSLSYYHQKSDVIYSGETKEARLANLGINPASEKAQLIANAHAVAPMFFESVEKYYGDRRVASLLGDSDTTLSNSAATIYHVTEEEGFNLTDINFWLRSNPERKDVIFEIYSGEILTPENLLLTQEYRSHTPNQHNAEVRLNEQLYFKKGETFTIVCHIPAGILYPLGASKTMEPSEAYNSLISLDWGQTWISLPQAMKGDENYVWNMIAISNYGYLGEYITLTPASGEVDEKSEMEVQLDINASKLINGNYQLVGIIESNDDQQSELRIPMNVVVSDQLPELATIQLLEFGNVFVGEEKELVVTLVNNGYGNFNDVQLISTNDDFEFETYPISQVKALSKVDYLVKFKPSISGNINAILKFEGSNGMHSVRLFGVGAAPSEIEVTPMSQEVTDVTIGDEIQASITVSNKGEYPLTYFIPGFGDEKVIEEWDLDYHSYGYRPKVSHKGETDYEWIEISDTGIDITDFMKKYDRKELETQFYPIELPFEFPFYDKKYTTLYFTSYVIMTVSDSIRLLNDPILDYSLEGIEGMVSAIGNIHSFSAGGKVFYQVTSDKLIVQYEAITLQNNSQEQVTLQFVIYDNGTIRLNYKDVENRSESIRYLWNVLIENPERNDGFRLAGFGEEKYGYKNLNMKWMNEMSIEFSYPGPDIIKNISNASGILMPGEANILDIAINTDELNQGVINKNINIIHNDPNSGSQLPNIQLDITNGGTASMKLQKDTIDFGEVYQEKEFFDRFKIENIGTANLNVKSVSLNSDRFVLEGLTSPVIKPKHFQFYTISALSDIIGKNSAEIQITLEDNSVETITVMADIRKAPKIEVDTTAVDFLLSQGSKDLFDLKIDNVGDTTLEVAVSATDWLYENRMTAAGLDTVKNFTYTYRNSTDEFGGPEYSWIDILGLEGTEHIHSDSIDINTPERCWFPVELPWEFNYYGNNYTSMHIGYNGVITFAGLLDIEIFNSKLPSDRVPNSILPMWCGGNYYPNNELEAKNMGIFHHSFDDKMVITFQSIRDIFGTGDPISFQVILYKDGTFKFQYKLEGLGRESLTIYSTIGLQNEDLSDYISISYQTHLKIESGLAISLSPSSKFNVEAGGSITKTMRLDASKVYGGLHDASIIIQSNSPNQEYLEKKVRLNVIGIPIVEIPDTLSYGEVVVENLGSKYKSYTESVLIKNTGTQEVFINSISLENGDDIKGELEVDDGIGGTFWMDIEYLRNPISIKPNIERGLRLIFSPSTHKVINERVKITFSDGTERAIIVDGEALLPPVGVISEEVLVVQLNTNTEEKEVSFNLANKGASVLNYDLKVNYFRDSTAISSSKLTNKALDSNKMVLARKEAEMSNLMIADTKNEDYNRILYYGFSDQPNTYVGFVGQGNFVASTHFNGGEEGFNISHVMSYLNYETLSIGEIKVEIRAGGASIYDATLLTETTYSFNNDKPKESEWLEVPLDEVVSIYPNEDFYVIFSYPFDINFPQGITNGEQSINRFMYLSEGVWYDLQAGGYGRDVFMMKVAEKDYEDNSWVVLDHKNGEVHANANADISLIIKGVENESQSHRAEIIVQTNDVNTPKQTVELIRNMNRAPYAEGIENHYEVMENDTLNLSFVVKDREGHTFTISTKHEELTLTQNVDTVSLSMPTD
ncbi:S8 family serine peptidase, partial [Flammeovirga aprica]